MAKATVELHCCDELHGVHRVRGMHDFVKSAWGVQYQPHSLSTRGDDLEAAVFDVGGVALLI
jgi:hypothetical protein